MREEKLGKEELRESKPHRRKVSKGSLAIISEDINLSLEWWGRALFG